MLRVRMSLFVVIALASLLAACSGEDEPEATASATASASPAASSSPLATASAAAAASASVGAGVPAGLIGFCGDWATLAAQSARLTAPSGTPANLKESFEVAGASLKRLADQAPNEIKADFQVFAKFWSDYAAVLAKVDYDMTKAATNPDLQKAMQGMVAPELQQAGTNITSWVQKNCTAGR